MHIQLKMDQRLICKTGSIERTKRNHRENASGHWSGQILFVLVPKSTGNSQQSEDIQNWRNI